ncbi:PAS domain-containing protein [Candidatus Caldatribacterium sp. SIUC1]|uniref:PAS domain-containing protein n=1 Tax=Candidatus Caldatribacterium sp. SIUC1 TaxID=3418365 RepID=UPI003F68E69F
MIGVILENARGEIVFANDEALRLLGIKQEDQKVFRTLREALSGSAGSWIPCSIGYGSSALEALVIPLARGGQPFGRAILLRESRSVSHREWNLPAAILDAIPDCVYAKDKGHRFLFANRATARYLGLSTREELLGKTDFDLKPRELAQQHWNEEEEFLCAGREILKREREIDDLTGKAWVATITILLRNDQGEVIGLVGVDRDITEQKLAEEAL